MIYDAQQLRTDGRGGALLPLPPSPRSVVRLASLEVHSSAYAHRRGGFYRRSGHAVDLHRSQRAEVRTASTPHGTPP